MTAFEIVALTGALAGISMVLGGIWLVGQGALTLASTPKSDALTIEWKKQFRMSTQVPGLAFFLVGLMFISISLGFLKPPEIVPIEFEGEIKGTDQPVTIIVRPINWELPASSGGRISGKVYPDLSLMVLMVNAPGYEPYTQSVKINGGSARMGRLGTVELRRKILESELERRVSTLPFAAPPASPSAAAFGVAQ